MATPRLLAKFRDTALQRLERLTRAVLASEAGEATADQFAEARRDLHTIKGESRLLGLTHCNALAHGLEDLLHTLPEQGRADGAVTDLLLRGFDALLDMIVRAVEGDRSIGDAASLMEEIDRALGGGDTTTEMAPPVVPAASAPAEDDDAEPAKESIASETAPTDTGLETVRVGTERISELTEIYAELRAGALRQGDMLTSLRALATDLDALTQRYTKTARSDDAGAQGLRRTLDELTGRARGLFEQTRNETHETSTLLERLGHLSWDMRLMPFSRLFERLPRAARDLARTLGRQVRVHTRGGDTEADQRVLDELDEVLLHLLRNAVDHGLEDPATRAAAGKDPTGTVLVTVRPYGARIEIVVADDGRGVDVNTVRRSVVERRLLSPEAAESTSDQDVLDLLFAPGFSTRGSVTNISGRGIGLDVVRQRVGALGGTIELESVPGQGTSFRMLVPASVTLSRVFVFRCGSGIYCVPSDAVKTVLRLDRSRDVETSGEARIIRVDERPVPLVDAGALLGQAPGSSEGQEGQVCVVVLEQLGYQRALAVSDFVGEHDVVQRPAGSFLDRSPLIRGAAILEDGGMAVALDVGTLLSDEGRLRRSVAASKTGQTRTGTIVVADDSELTRDVVVGMLRDGGYVVREASDGKGALALLDTGAADLLLTDLQMPVMDGFALIKAVRERARTSDLPIIVLSTLGSEADRQQAARVGADAYLVKSELKAERLLSTVKRYVRTRLEQVG
jgi:chemotaxis protein histidine kinase CheA/ActR/RegA family two-component response regulator